MKTNQHELLNYIVEGEGPPVILLHGLSASLMHWQLLIPELTDAGYCALAVDLLGHGDSVKPDDSKYFTAQVLLTAIEDWIDQLEIDGPFNLVGHSLGGYLALRLAQRHPDKINAMVLIDPLFCVDQLNLLMSIMMPVSGMGVKILTATPLWVVQTYLNMDQSFIRGLSPSIRKWYARDVKRASPFFLDIPGTIIDLEPLLDQITPETLVIWGDDDHLERPESFKRLIRGLPNARGCVVHGAGHQPHHERPEPVNRLIVDYFDQHNGKLPSEEKE